MKLGTTEQYIKAMRRASRLLEIERHGKVISTRPAMVSKSKKAFDRKKSKSLTKLDYL